MNPVYLCVCVWSSLRQELEKIIGSRETGSAVTVHSPHPRLKLVLTAAGFENSRLRARCQAS